MVYLSIRTDFSVSHKIRLSKLRNQRLVTNTVSNFN